MSCLVGVVVMRMRVSTHPFSSNYTSAADVSHAVPARSTGVLDAVQSALRALNEAGVLDHSAHSMMLRRPLASFGPVDLIGR